MLLKPSLVLLTSFSSQEEAILMASQALETEGYVLPGYGQSMLGRETQVSTYLGEGVAIPHGIREDLNLVQHAGICILRSDKAVQWGEEGDAKVRLVFALAAKHDDAHLAVLGKIASLVIEPENLEALMEAPTPAALIEAFESVS